MEEVKSYEQVFNYLENGKSIFWSYIQTILGGKLIHDNIISN